jgi:ribose transport system ATP-binding protein
MTIDGLSEADPPVLVLDEATASVPKEDADTVLQMVRRLSDSGVAVLIVTHRLSEAVSFADRVTVLNDGYVVYSGADRLTPDAMVSLIVAPSPGQGGPDTSAALRAGLYGVGQPNEKPSPVAVRTTRAKVLQVSALHTRTLVDVGFSVESGEIVGFVGGPESGVEEVPGALAGLEPGVTGTLRIDDRGVQIPASPRAAIRLGIALVPRDRHRQGGVGMLSLYENIVLPTARGVWFRTAARNQIVAGVIAQLDVRPPDDAARLGDLSGGNQQKVIVGKWLSCRPKVLILDDPTVGIDPGARATLFSVIKHECAANGLAVIMFSSEPEQLVEHCERVIVIQAGMVTGELTGDDLSDFAVSRVATA